MAKRLYSFPNTTEAQDELAAVKQMLHDHGIDHYETPGSIWGFSRGSLWISDDEQLEKARSLFEQLQTDYAAQARREYQQQTGYNPDAPLAEKIRFQLRFLRQRKAALPLLLIAAVLFFIYFKMFFGLFSAQ